MKFRILLIILFQVSCFFSAEAQLDTVLQRYKEYLFRTDTAKSETAQKWARSLNANGQWPDIDYQDTEPAAWKVPLHLRRVKEMALAWAKPQSTDYHNQELSKKINTALDHWLQKRYQSSNWWHNQIGVPQYMRDIIILFHDGLDAGRLKKSLEVMAQLQVHDNYTGGNLVWCADLGLHYGVLTGDEKLVKRCRDLILKEIKITTGEGIQPDYSFHQHGKRLQMYQYGKAFLWESLRIGWELRKTPLAYPEDKVDILTDMVLKGWQWMARGVNTVPGTMDRSASRKGELRSPDLRPLIPFIIELYPEKTAELKKMEAVQNGEGALNGFRYYPYSDFAAFHRPGFSFFLKTISSRTLPTEAINHENLKGKLLNSGDTYLIRNGNEYFDLMPVWDWAALPGVTAFKDAHQIERKPFAGAVSDKTDGFSVMDYVLKDKTGSQVLSARKFWACSEDAVVCLISDIKTENIPGNIYTALEQCRWQGDVTVNKRRNVLDSGVHKLDNVKWIHHAGFAYIPLQPVSIELRMQQVSGTWTSINASETTAPVKEKVFTPLLIHSAQESAAGYALAFCETSREAEKLAAKPDWKVLRNDKNCQAVQFKDGTVMAAFYAPEQLKAGKRISLQADKPCLVLLKDGMLYASDPSHKGISVTIRINSRKFTLALPEDGSTVAEKMK